MSDIDRLIHRAGTTTQIRNDFLVAVKNVKLLPLYKTLDGVKYTDLNNIFELKHGVENESDRLGVFGMYDYLVLRRYSNYPHDGEVVGEFHLTIANPEDNRWYHKVTEMDIVLDGEDVTLKIYNKSDMKTPNEIGVSDLIIDTLFKGRVSPEMDW